MSPAAFLFYSRREDRNRIDSNSSRILRCDLFPIRKITFDSADQHPPLQEEPHRAASGHYRGNSASSSFQVNNNNSNFLFHMSIGISSLSNRAIRVSIWSVFRLLFTSHSLSTFFPYFQIIYSSCHHASISVNGFQAAKHLIQLFYLVGLIRFQSEYQIYIL